MQNSPKSQTHRLNYAHNVPAIETEDDRPGIVCIHYPGGIIGYKIELFLDAIKFWLTDYAQPSHNSREMLFHFFHAMRNSKVITRGGKKKIEMDHFPAIMVSCVRVLGLGGCQVIQDVTHKISFFGVEFTDHYMMALTHFLLTSTPLTGPDDPRLAFLGAVDAMKVEQKSVQLEQIVLRTDCPAPRPF